MKKLRKRKGQILFFFDKMLLHLRAWLKYGSRAPDASAASIKKTPVGKMSGSRFSTNFSELLFKRQAWYKAHAPAIREIVEMQRIP